MVSIVPSMISAEKKRTDYSSTYIWYMILRAVLGSVYALVVYSATLAHVLPITIPADLMTAIPFLAVLGFASGFSDRLFGQVLSGFITGAGRAFEEEGRRRLGGMTAKFRVIVLIGQVASGKTAVARELARQLTVRVTGIEQLQAARSDTSPAGIARELRGLTGSGTVVYECSGAPPGFRRDAVRDRSERGGTVRCATGGEFRDCVAPAAGARPA